MTNVEQPPFPAEQYQPRQSNSNKGCLWGCLIAAVLFVAAILCAGFGGYFFLTGQIEKYTSDKPVDLPSVEYNEAEMEALNQRVESFREKLKSGETPEEDLVLTADDINAMISDNEDLKGKIFVKIENNQVEGDVSFPLDKLPGGKGRFFNGSATFDVSMEGGVLIVTADQAEVNGEAVPDQFMEAMRQENLAKDIYKDPENAKFMRQFEDIRIEDDKFILRVKRDGDGAAESGDAAAGEAESGDTEAAGTEAGDTESVGTEAAGEVSDQ